MPSQKIGNGSIPIRLQPYGYAPDFTALGSAISEDKMLSKKTAFTPANGNVYAPIPI